MSVPDSLRVVGVRVCAKYGGRNGVPRYGCVADVSIASRVGLTSALVVWVGDDQEVWVGWDNLHIPVAAHFADASLWWESFLIALWVDGGGSHALRVLAARMRAAEHRDHMGRSVRRDRDGAGAGLARFNDQVVWRVAHWKGIAGLLNTYVWDDALAARVERMLCPELPAALSFKPRVPTDAEIRDLNAGMNAVRVGAPGPSEHHLKAREAFVELLHAPFDNGGAARRGWDLMKLLRDAGQLSRGFVAEGTMPLFRDQGMDPYRMKGLVGLEGAAMLLNAFAWDAHLIGALRAMFPETPKAVPTPQERDCAASAKQAAEQFNAPAQESQLALEARIAEGVEKHLAFFDKCFSQLSSRVTALEAKVGTIATMTNPIHDEVQVEFKKFQTPPLQVDPKMPKTWVEIGAHAEIESLRRHLAPLQPLPKLIMEIRENMACTGFFEKFGDKVPYEKVLEKALERLREHHTAWNTLGPALGLGVSTPLPEMVNQASSRLKDIKQLETELGQYQRQQKRTTEQLCATLGMPDASLVEALAAVDALKKERDEIHHISEHHATPGRSLPWQVRGLLMSENKLAVLAGNLRKTLGLPTDAKEHETWDALRALVKERDEFRRAFKVLYATASTTGEQLEQLIKSATDSIERDDPSAKLERVMKAVREIEAATAARREANKNASRDTPKVEIDFAIEKDGTIRAVSEQTGLIFKVDDKVRLKDPRNLGDVNHPENVIGIVEKVLVRHPYDDSRVSVNWGTATNEWWASQLELAKPTMAKGARVLVRSETPTSHPRQMGELLDDPAPARGMEGAPWVTVKWEDGFINMWPVSALELAPADGPKSDEPKRRPSARRPT